MCKVHGDKFIASCIVLEGFECCACCSKSEEGCEYSVGKYDEVGSKLSNKLHNTILNKIKQNAYKGYPYEDKEMAIMIAEMDRINIDKYPELLIIREIFRKCAESKEYENFARMTLNNEFVKSLDSYLKSVENRKNAGYDITI
ncbi:hypothetical protein [Alkaliphilus sp. B6464]|uniref:hypothetical protein n=1 Tax=Alkaliphilus sp. B6464 TaxID=2731219 RepID=UPI001BADE6B5|nr:hypothetical protein [Alkaliphilus sp. B6464]QUH22081.1 hypothetical protein HYG84_19435 [Alkaliphilus sp. B6464]